jgi:hypothetical protein
MGRTTAIGANLQTEIFFKKNKKILPLDEKLHKNRFLRIS